MRIRLLNRNVTVPVIFLSLAMADISEAMQIRTQPTIFPNLAEKICRVVSDTICSGQDTSRDGGILNRVNWEHINERHPLVITRGIEHLPQMGDHPTTVFYDPRGQARSVQELLVTAASQYGGRGIEERRYETLEGDVNTGQAKIQCMYRFTTVIGEFLARTVGINQGNIKYRGENVLHQTKWLTILVNYNDENARTDSTPQMSGAVEIETMYPDTGSAGEVIPAYGGEYLADIESQYDPRLRAMIHP